MGKKEKLLVELSRILKIKLEIIENYFCINQLHSMCQLKIKYFAMNNQWCINTIVAKLHGRKYTPFDIFNFKTAVFVSTDIQNIKNLF